LSNLHIFLFLPHFISFYASIILWIYLTTCSTELMC
jgi:hypothetical protein